MTEARLAQRSEGVRPVSANELGVFYRMLARAFSDDPVTEFLFPDARTRLRRLQAFYRSMMPSMAAHGRMDTDASLRGGAVWQAPSPPKPNPWQIVSLLVRSALALRGRALSGIELGQTLEAVHERRPHWYLSIIGTDPEHRGVGIGSALIAPVLEQCDRDGVLAYLESSKEANLRFYERHGFEVQREVTIPKGPVLWPMLRLPRTGLGLGRSPGTGGAA